MTRVPLDTVAQLALCRPGRRLLIAGLTAVLLAAVLLTAAAPGTPAAAQEADPDPRLTAAAGTGALAFALTGDAAVDEASRLGLSGLSDELARRTTVEPGPPVGVDPGRDDLSLLTFLYWPITAGQPLPSPQAYAALNRFLRTGGMILFDTRDSDLASLGGPDRQADLQRLAAGLDIPPLAPITPDHVLNRSFYLLSAAPGRHDGPLWVEAPAPDAQAAPASGGGGAGAAAGFAPANDGVSPVVIGGNDWAAAWAVDAQGLPAYAVGSGYDGERRRELALRFGINLVMYALSGNYKADQVHVPEVLERLGRDTLSAADPGPDPGPDPEAPQ